MASAAGDGIASSQECHLMNRALDFEPALVVGSKGLELYLSTGQTILDACAGAAVAVLGHHNEEVHQAMIQQARKVSYVHTQAYSTPVAEELANIVLEGSPLGLEKALFLGSGSEAVDAAMKLARQYFYEKGETQRLHFVSRRQAYHGYSIGSMSLSSNVARKVQYEGFAYPNVSYVSHPYAYRYQNPDESEEAFVQRLVQEVEDEFLRIGPEKVIAFVAETVSGATTGCVVSPPGYFAGVRAVCDKYGILLFLDEIMCGTGRCGEFFAFEREGIEADIVTLAKGLGGGFASIGGIMMHRKVVDVLRQGSKALAQGHTYQAHPISCAAALAVQKIIKRDNLIEQCAKLGRVLESLLHEELDGCRSVGNIRGRGLFWGVEFVTDKQTKATFDPKTKFGVEVQQEAFRRGVAVYPGSGTVDGRRGDHVLVAPPFTVTEEQLKIICRVLKESIEAQEKLHL